MEVTTVGTPAGSTVGTRARNDPLTARPAALVPVLSQPTRGRRGD